MTTKTTKVENTKRQAVSLFCFITLLTALSGAAVSGCKQGAGGGAAVTDTDAKKFSTRVDPNNPPPEAVAAMAKMRAKGTPTTAGVPVSTPPPSK